MVSKTVPTKTPTDDSPESLIRILKTATCKTLAGTSSLSYQLGLDEDDNLHWRIESNSGGGMFSNEWISHSEIEAAFDDWPEDKPINSMTLRPLFQGKSVNTPAFLLAALSAEKLLEPMPKKKRCHVACDDSSFLESIDMLKDKPTTTRKKTSAKATAKSGTRGTAKTDKTRKKARSSNQKAK